MGETPVSLGSSGPDESNESEESANSVDIDRAKLDRAIEAIRPALQADGGDMEVVEITDDGVVKVSLVGACGTCPISTTTLKAGVERILKDRVPGVREVVDIADLADPILG